MVGCQLKRRSLGVEVVIQWGDKLSVMAGWNNSSLTRRLGSLHPSRIKCYCSSPLFYILSSLLFCFLQKWFHIRHKFNCVKNIIHYSTLIHHRGQVVDDKTFYIYMCSHAWLLLLLKSQGILTDSFCFLSHKSSHCITNFRVTDRIIPLTCIFLLISHLKTPNLVTALLKSRCIWVYTAKNSILNY